MSLVPVQSKDISDIRTVLYAVFNDVAATVTGVNKPDASTLQSRAETLRGLAETILKIEQEETKRIPKRKTGAA